jgi:hypothetical protein
MLANQDSRERNVLQTKDCLASEIADQGPRTAILGANEAARAG